MISEHTFVFKDGSVRTIDCNYCRELETTNWHYDKIEWGSSNMEFKTRRELRDNKEELDVL